jgi:aspartokinase/homoserine dehydrogenase 1
MRVLKFGGSSVGSPKLIKEVLSIILDRSRGPQPQAVAVSALYGVTNSLVRLADLATAQQDCRAIVSELKDRHIDALNGPIEGLPDPEELGSLVTQQINTYFTQLESLLQGVQLVGECSPTTRDRILSFGEYLSARILTCALRLKGVPAEFIDATSIIKVRKGTQDVRIDFDVTNALIRDRINHTETLYVVTGFIASNEDGQVTTLGRGGSDYTASILAAALGASCLEIWTDVDGVMTSDPRRVGKAFVLERLSFQEALELCHFGAKVIYPPTLQPVMSLGIPIRILNTFKPEKPGTLISSQPAPTSQAVTGISSIASIALIQVQGSGMIGVAGIAMRLFSALARQQINVILITQASSEHNICVAISEDRVKAAQEALNDEFTLELQAGLIDPIAIETGLAIVSIVGERMRHRIGISGQVFGALGHNGINIRAIAQGSSERNISVVIGDQYETKALNVLHEEFFTQVEKRANVFLIGVGLIGTKLLEQIYSHREALRQEHSIDIRVVGIANSSLCVTDSEGLTTTNARDLLKERGKTISLQELTTLLEQLRLSNTIVVDCTASALVAETYLKFLELHIPVVTPNKKAQSGSSEYFQRLKKTARRYDVPFLYETSVGAGLPVISTLNDLRKSGDEIISIQAVLSGTLSYLFNSWTGSKTFSATIRQAQQLGFTEPDPRDDLNGLDVARKILILARECGATIELADVAVHNLVPEPCQKTESLEEFYEILEGYDREMEELRAITEKQGKRLCYIASFSKDSACTKLEAIDDSHPFWDLSGSDNIISFTTERYSDRPLVIKGPGAGAAVTAAGILADIIRISRPLIG